MSGMIEETLREIVRNKIIKILEKRLGKEMAVEVEKMLSHEERGRILKEYERSGNISENTYNYIISKYCCRDLTSILFGIPSEIRVYPEITDSMIGSGKFGVLGLRKHVRELGYSEDKFEEILRALYIEIKKLSRDPKYLELLATACLEIGVFYLEFDYRRAEEFLNEAYEHRNSLKDNSRFIKLLNSFLKLGISYARLKKVEKAKLIYEKIQVMMKETRIDQKEITDLFRELEKLIGVYGI